MGQAKNRGTYEERKAQALALPPKPKKLSARERDQLVAEAVTEVMSKYMGGLFNSSGRNRETILL